MKRKKSKGGAKPMILTAAVVAVVGGIYFGLGPGPPRPSEDAQSLLSWLITKPRGPQNDIVDDLALFTGLFDRVHSGPEFQGLTRSADLLAQVEDGATLRYGPGVFRVDLIELLCREGGPPADLTVSGAGADETLLLVSGLAAHDDIERLTLRDCTIHTEGGDLFSYTPGCVTVTMSGVRAVGFDRDEEKAAAFHVPCGLLRATDCEFLGGYGPDPGSGALLSVLTGGLLARFERCTFRDTIFSSAKLRSGFTLRFDACRFEGTLDNPSEVTVGHAGITMVGTSVEPRPPGRGEVEQRLVDELFPDWQARTVH